MKKGLKRLGGMLMVLGALLLTGCNEVDAPFVGHTYACEESGNVISFQFFETGQCSVLLATSEQQFMSSNLTFKYKGEMVTISYDRSSTWNEEVQGTVLTMLTYDAVADVMYLQGVTLSRVN